MQMLFYQSLVLIGTTCRKLLQTLATTDASLDTTTTATTTPSSAAASDGYFDDVLNSGSVHQQFRHFRLDATLGLDSAPRRSADGNTIFQSPYITPGTRPRSHGQHGGVGGQTPGSAAGEDGADGGGGHNRSTSKSKTRQVIVKDIEDVG